MLYMILLHQQFKHPGAPKIAPAASTGNWYSCYYYYYYYYYIALGSISSTPFPESDIGNITLALRTLGSFNFGGLFYIFLWIIILMVLFL